MACGREAEVLGDIPGKKTRRPAVTQPGAEGLQVWLSPRPPLPSTHTHILQPPSSEEGSGAALLTGAGLHVAVTGGAPIAPPRPRGPAPQEEPHSGDDLAGRCLRKGAVPSSPGLRGVSTPAGALGRTQDGDSEGAAVPHPCGTGSCFPRNPDSHPQSLQGTRKHGSKRTFMT